MPLNPQISRSALLLLLLLATSGCGLSAGGHRYVKFVKDGSSFREEEIAPDSGNARALMIAGRSHYDVKVITEGTGGGIMPGHTVKLAADDREIRFRAGVTTPENAPFAEAVWGMSEGSKWELKERKPGAPVIVVEAKKVCRELGLRYQIGSDGAQKSFKYVTVWCAPVSTPALEKPALDECIDRRARTCALAVEESLTDEASAKAAIDDVCVKRSPERCLNLAIASLAFKSIASHAMKAAKPYLTGRIEELSVAAMKSPDPAAVTEALANLAESGSTSSYMAILGAVRDHPMVKAEALRAISSVYGKVDAPTREAIMKAATSLPGNVVSEIQEAIERSDWDLAREEQKAFREAMDPAYKEAAKKARLEMANAAPPEFPDDGAGEKDELLKAIKMGDEAKVRAILMRGRLTYATDANGSTPLHVAAAKGKIGIVKQLLAANPSLSLVANRKGERPADLAVKGSFEEISALIRDQEEKLETGAAWYKPRDAKPVSPDSSALVRVPRPREGHSVTALQNGRMLVTGGGNGGHTYLWSPESGKATPIRPLMDRKFHIAKALPNGNVVLVGGDLAVIDGKTPTLTAEVWDVELRTSSVHSLDVPAASEGPGEAPVNAVVAISKDFDAIVASIVHVKSPKDAFFTEIYRLTPKVGEVRQTLGRLVKPRKDFHMAALDDGKILIFGGVTYSADAWQTENVSSELFDPATGQSAQAGSLPDPVQEHQGFIVLKSHRVLAYGHEGLDLWDPDTRKWSRKEFPTALRGKAVTGLKARPNVIQLRDETIAILRENGHMDFFREKNGKIRHLRTSDIGYGNAAIAPHIWEPRLAIAGADDISDGELPIYPAYVYDPPRNTLTPKYLCEGPGVKKCATPAGEQASATPPPVGTGEGDDTP